MALDGFDVQAQNESEQVRLALGYLERLSVASSVAWGAGLWSRRVYRQQFDLLQEAGYQPHDVLSQVVHQCLASLDLGAHEHLEAIDVLADVLAFSGYLRTRAKPRPRPADLDPLNATH